MIDRNKVDKVSGWQHWDLEVERLKKIGEHSSFKDRFHHWQSSSMYVFLQALNQNVLDENATYDSILKRVIEAILTGFGLTQVRAYRAILLDDGSIELTPTKSTEEHQAEERKESTRIIKQGSDDLVDTLFSHESIWVEEALTLKLILEKSTFVSSPYLAIPLFSQGKPFGLICADTITKDGEQSGTMFQVYKENIQFFAFSIMAAIENWHISQQRKHESQQLYEDQAKYQAELSRIDRATELSVIISSFFHDLKKPIGKLQSAINLIDMNLTSKDPSIEKYINYAKDASKMILLDFEAYTNNFSQTAYKRMSVKLRELISKTLEMVKKTIGLKMNLSGNYAHCDFSLYCHPTFIDLAFRSIIGNAVKFSEKLPLDKRYLKINITPGENEEWVDIEFESSTIHHIPDDKLKAIFKPFERFITSEPGSGLGLSLADLCVKMHGGDIKAENVMGEKKTKAVRFKITLPQGREYNIAGVVK